MKTLVALARLLTTRRTVAAWLHEWTAPDAALSPIELIAFWCAQQLAPRKTLKEWGQHLGPKLRSETDTEDAADTGPLSMLEVGLLSAILANDQARIAAYFGQLTYHHARINALHLAMKDPTYPRDDAEVAQASAYVRGETDHPEFAVRRVLATLNEAAQGKALAGGNGAAR